MMSITKADERYDYEYEDYLFEKEWNDFKELTAGLDVPEVVTTKKRWGFKSRTQLPLFMMWEEDWCNGEVVYGRVTFNSRDWIGI
jgi:hypothetical protein